MRTLHKGLNQLRSRKGVSLAELLLAIGLMAFVATAAIGGIVVVNRVKETIDKQARAQMIMIATVSYLRADLNSCSNPCNMDCTNPYDYAIDDNHDNAYYPVFYIMDPASYRYTKFILKNENGSVTGNTQGFDAKVQYYNTPKGICVGLKFKNDIKSVNGLKAPLKTRKYILGQNVMAGTGMISIIGGVTYDEGTANYDPDFDKYAKPGMIVYSDETKLFYFTIDVIDEKTGEVILSQRVTVCPDTLMPTIP